MDCFRDALSVLRVQLFDDVNQYEKLLATPYFLWEKPRKNNIPPFNSLNELRVLMELNMLIEHKLSGYPRTLEGDQYTLDNDSEELSQAKMFALLITIEEK